MLPPVIRKTRLDIKKKKIQIDPLKIKKMALLVIFRNIELMRL